MKYDPNSSVRSQREEMQAYQLRLPKEQIRELQILRVLAGVKVSEELRALVTQFLADKKNLINSTVKSAAKDIK